MRTSLDRNAKLSLTTFAFTATALAARGRRTANSNDASPVRLALKMGSACEGGSGALCCAFGGVFGMAVNGWWPRYDIVSWKKASRTGQEDIAVQQAFRTLGHRSATRRRATMSQRNNRQSRLDRQVLLWQGSGQQISGLLRRPSDDQRQTFENRANGDVEGLLVGMEQAWIGPMACVIKTGGDVLGPGGAEQVVGSYRRLRQGSIG